MRTRIGSWVMVMVLALQLLSGSARADAPTPAWMPPVAARADARLSRGLAMKRVGINLSLLGTVVLVASQALIGVSVASSGLRAYGEHCGGTPSCPPSSDDQSLGGAAIGTFVGASLILAAGIPLWAVGAKEAREASAAPRLTVGPTSIGLRF